MSPMLLREWNYSDPAGWIVQEKYDGIRAIWDGIRLLTRQGVEVPCPDWFVATLPPEPLDGELWTGRGDLAGMLSIFSTGVSGDWDRVNFVVFDAPSGLPLEQRLASLDRLERPYHCRVAPSTVCIGMADLEDILDGVASKGGEGIVLRKPESRYEHKRSGNARKLRLVA